MMLWTKMFQLNRDSTDHRELLEGLRLAVRDAPSLTTIIDNRLKPQKESAELRRMEAAHAKRTKRDEQSARKAHASWVTFWSEIVRDPDAVFAVGRAENTARNLWPVSY